MKTKEWFNLEKTAKALDECRISYTVNDLYNQDKLDELLGQLAEKIVFDRHSLGAGISRNAYKVCDGIVMKISKEIFMTEDDLYEEDNYYDSEMENEESRAELNETYERLENEINTLSSMPSFKETTCSILNCIDTIIKKIIDLQEDIQVTERIINSYNELVSGSKIASGVKEYSEQGSCELQVYESILCHFKKDKEYVAEIYSATREGTIILVEECTPYYEYDDDEEKSKENENRRKYLINNFEDMHDNNMMLNSIGKLVAIDLGM